MAPTVTSTLPSPRHSILSPGLNVGRLRIVPQSGYAGALYISRSMGIITARADALQVQFLQSADPHRIGMLVRTLRTSARMVVATYIYSLKNRNVTAGALTRD